MPEQYYQFVMRYAPYFYVIPTKMVADPPAGQRNVTVADGSKFQAGCPVEIKDDAHSEWNRVAAVNGNVLTMEDDLQYIYYVNKNGRVEGPDPAFGRGAFPAAFAINFLHEAYHAEQFESRKTDILGRIVELAEWLLTQQCTDERKRAYGGFRNSEAGVEFWSVDAGRCIPALLEAYELTGTAEYLEGAKRAGIFLYNMQHKPSELGIHDRYYGGFARYVTMNDDWSQPMNVEDLYSLIGLRMLCNFDPENRSVYQAMMKDAVEFLRSGFEQLYLWFNPKPFGDGQWHRVGLNETEVYDDPVAFALLGLYAYEGWSSTCQRVYNFVQTIRASAQYPAYHPAVCWPGYIDVVTRFPACPYYDAVTSGILWKIRAAHDKPSLAFSMKIIEKHWEAWMFWGPRFTDYSPVTPQKAMANVTWLGRLFLNYEEPSTPFTRLLRAYGEGILLYPVRASEDRVEYGGPLHVPAFVSPSSADEVLLEPGYIIEDYLTVYTYAPLRVRDKIRRKGEDYEVKSVQAFDWRGETAYYRAVCRRLIGQ
ncbi:MAG: pectate lyase [Candidatus Bathyarchaeota archaeon]|nr:pectate lyase [Candidatus Bathyarchaeota archaeon]